jgi:stearoyl-CoA desaturase (Delta-9 desaturase)
VQVYAPDVPDATPVAGEHPTARPTNEPPEPDPAGAGRAVTAILVFGPLIGLATVLVVGWGHLISVEDVALSLALYVFTGFGISVGFHRLFAHHSFKANPVLKGTLAVAGSMALEGSVISWVAIHRRHHMFSDLSGDPHSPHRYDTGASGIVRGLLWAHVGWLFSADSTDSRRFAPEHLRDKTLVVVDKLFPALAIASLAIPFGVGWLLWGTLAGAFSAFLWAGLVRMALLHHVTWSINSVCHLWGRRPFVTRDNSGNVAPLALVSFGESWHNFHHSAPASARHGVLDHQLDPAARLIRVFEFAGWATKVRWPSAAQVANLATDSPLAERSPTPTILLYENTDLGT